MAEMPEDDTTPVAILERSAFTCAAVYADTDARGLEAPLRSCHVGLKNAVRSLEDIREDEQGKLAVLSQLDGGLDRAVNEFVGRLFLLVGKNYDHPTYRRYVPKSVRDITQADMRTEEPVLVAKLLTLLDEDKAKTGIDELANEFIPQLQTAHDAVVAAEQDLTTTETAADHLEDDTIPALIVDWTVEYKKLNAALTAAWPLDPDRVRRCFKPFRKPKKKAKKAAEPVQPGTG